MSLFCFEKIIVLFVGINTNGTLAFTKIGNRTYYRPDDVERVVGNVEEKRKEARWKGKTI